MPARRIAGSEHAVGWNWTTGAHRLGHQGLGFGIDGASRGDRGGVPRRQGSCGHKLDLSRGRRLAATPRSRAGLGADLQSLVAICRRCRHARALQREVRFDAIHHLTWGGVRAPTFLGSLGAPLIVGPIGGGETSPMALRDVFTARSRSGRAHSRSLQRQHRGQSDHASRARAGKSHLREDPGHAATIDGGNAAQVPHLFGADAATLPAWRAARPAHRTSAAALCRPTAVLEGRAHRHSRPRAAFAADARGAADHRRQGAGGGAVKGRGRGHEPRRPDRVHSVAAAAATSSLSTETTTCSFFQVCTTAAATSSSRRSRMACR